MTTTLNYLDPTDVIAKRYSEPPHVRLVQGSYGNKIPTGFELQLRDKRWRRVYCICWSNSGSLYVVVGGKNVYLGTYDPRD